MKEYRSIQLKAALLLIVFSLNTVFGFACSMGLDMGYNKSHHAEEATEVAVHVHNDGKKHQHENEPKKPHHVEPVANCHDKKDATKKDDCCTDEVFQFQQLDKNITAKTGINMPVYLAILTTFFKIDNFKSVHSSSPKYIASYFHPPPPDIRVAIQSFQI